MMTKDEIKKALECCLKPSINSCKDCPYNNNGEFSCCDGEMYKDALNLITEQEQEIERLKDDYAKLQELFAQYQMASDKEIKAQVKQAKIEAVKEFAEELKSKTMCITEYEDGTRILQTSNKLIDQNVNIFLTNC